MINYFNLKPIKRLTVVLRKVNGRNVYGRITSYHRGGGVARRYRLIDFKRSLFNVPAFIRRFEYDPNRNSYIVLLCYVNGVLSYSLLAEGMRFGSSVLNTKEYLGEIFVGMATFLKNFSIGSIVYNLELLPNSSSKLVRSSGLAAQILKKVGARYISVKLPSGEIRILNANILANFGKVSNSNYKNIKLVKAGQNRLYGRRPIVRGVAMNPIDHPHGGNTSGGRPSVSPWGKLAKGGKTRNLRKNSGDFILKTRVKNE